MTVAPLADYWDLKREALRANLAHEPLEQFLSWPTVLGTMFVGPGELAELEQTELNAAPDAYRWSSAIGTEYGGAPNTNLAHQAYHLYQWERATGLRVESLGSIAEVGGGYGALARVCRRLGFTGLYTIYDLPEVGMLQRHYLEWAGVQVDLRETLAESVHVDLFIGLFSLSEMAVDTLEHYLSRIQSRHWLIGCKDGQWDGVDLNVRLRERFAAGQLVYAPHLAGAYYLVG